MTINSNLSKTFDLLRFPLAVLVVLLHIQPTVLPIQLDRLIAENPSEKIYLWVNMIGTKLATCAVPTFFCISGYLLVYNIKKLDFKVYLNKIKKRIFTLFIPFIIWNLLALGYLWSTQQITAKEINFSFIFISPANFPLWFLRDLISLVIVFPVFYWISRYGGTSAFLILTLFFIVGCSYYSFINLYYVYISSIYFFYTGIFCGTKKWHLDNLQIGVKMFILICFIGLLISSCLVRGYYSYYVNNLYLISAVGTVFIITHWCVSHLGVTAIGILSSASFFVYCSHKLGPTFLSKLGFHYLNLESDIMIYLFSPLLTVALCLGIYYLLQRFTPKTLKILTGR